jgi:hypothetical protein
MRIGVALVSVIRHWIASAELLAFERALYLLLAH